MCTKYRTSVQQDGLSPAECPRLSTSVFEGGLTNPRVERHCPHPQVNLDRITTRRWRQVYTTAEDWYVQQWQRARLVYTQLFRAEKKKIMALQASLFQHNSPHARRLNRARLNATTHTQYNIANPIPAPYLICTQRDGGRLLSQ